MDVWLTASNTTWNAPDFRVAGAQTNTDVPVFLRLMEMDDIDHIGDDHEDVNPNVGARDIGFLYSHASGQARGDVAGAGPYVVEGRGGEDRARVRFRMSQIVGTSK